MFNFFKKKQRPCPHKKVESIFRDLSIDYNFYEGFCTQCEEQVYATLWFNGHSVRWTTDRSAAFKEKETK